MKRHPWTLRLARAFGRAQRPVAWSILAGGIVTLIAVVFDVVATGDAKAATILGAVLIINDGVQSVMEVENELDSEASAEE